MIEELSEHDKRVVQILIKASNSGTADHSTMESMYRGFTCPMRRYFREMTEDTLSHPD
ncbi:hypothetical protein HOF56_00265 [Candidatus Peribacteria bacterium]|jgi:hypothetical protein|nr:hypothetical protein [Candidatus Peribacteria bacterium]MBT4020950.1 hypothetical protein [Candidatus Peribacteria bacterium]MBT4240300.1 hypothetical protein [Candidatus Peribacteria bacterium]MBT4474102.1 hypothetical protein [Candidatus Peribacteria bacterium]